MLIGCQTAVPPTVEPTISAPTATAAPPAADMPATATAVSSPTPTPIPPATPAATATAAPQPISLSAEPGVPLPLVEAGQALAASAPARFTWQDAGGAVRLTTTATDAPLATWVYAAAAPFPTFTDAITLTELQAAWAAGELTLTEETAALLAAWWGEPERPSTIVSANDIAATVWAQQTGYDDPALTLLPADQLTPELKVLRLNGAAPIDVDFDPADYGLALPVYLAGAAADVASVQAAWTGAATNWDDGRVTHIAMTGPAGMRRAVADRMEKYGMNYPAEETGPVLQAADIAHMSNENAFASDCPPPDPYDSDNVCNQDKTIEIMTWMGIDVNEMTGNHLNDWGPQSLLHTFDMYEERGIETFGGGRDLADAREPLLMEHNGNRIAFVGCNPVGPPIGWAAENYPGSLPCEEDYEAIKAQIAELDAAGYIVIATLQYLEDYQYRTLQPQRDAFRGLAAAGATAVSGSHGHHPQGFAFHEGGFIHYGLGNFLADQMWSWGTRQMFIDTYVIYDGRLVSVDLWTGLIEDYARPRLMTPAERRELLQAVFDVSDW